MFRLVLILGFVVSSGMNGLDGVTPHFEGEGGCSPECCRAARKKGNDVRAVLCCFLNGGQSGETNSSSATSQTIRPRNRNFSATYYIFEPKAGSSIAQTNFPNSPTINNTDSSNRYLETGSL